MFPHRLIRSGILVNAIVISLLALATSAQANASLSCGYKDLIFNGEVDFGSGNHSLGSPEHNASVGWSFQSFNGVIAVTARVRGTLYLDKSGGGCARLRINFQDSNFNNIQATQDRSFCGPGNNANNSANRLNIDVTSFANPQLRRVQLTLGEGQTLSSIVDLHTGGVLAPSTNVSIPDRINNGNTDFGGNSHSWGGPSSDGFIDLTLRNNGRVFGRVNGVLYWDDYFNGGTARMITEFRNSNGAVLQSRRDQIRGNGGDANNIANKVGVLQLFNSTSLSNIRLRVGKVSNGHFVDVATRNYSFGCP